MCEDKLKNKTPFPRGGAYGSPDVWAIVLAAAAAVLFVIYIVTIGP